MSLMSKISKCAASLILVLLVLSMMPNVLLDCTSLNVVKNSKNSEKIIANEPHGPIVINGDANFTSTALAEGWTGTGSVQEPYIIENYDFVLGFTPISSVNISHTQSHFIIRNCNFQGPLATPSYGIFLDNVTNAQIIDNVVTGYSHAVTIPITSSNIFASGNNCSFNSYGIYLHDSEDSTVINNICNGNFFYGIFLHTCESSSVINNICNEDPMAGIYIYNCSFNTVSGNTCNDSDFGIYLQERGSHVVTSNLCANNSNCGFFFDNCDLNTIANNTSIDNTMYGITLQNMADFNNVQWNALINNPGDDASDFSSGNVFTYNYYSDYSGVDANQDYIGDTSHTFLFNSDSYPLMYVPFAPEWVTIPKDQIIEFGNNFEYNFQFLTLEPSAPYELHVNDSANFVVINDEMIQSRITLPVGDYPLDVNTTNAYGYYTKEIFTLAVRDTTPPIITHPDDITITVGDEGPQLEWTLSDLSPLIYSLLRNGTEISSSTVPTTAVYFSTTIETYTSGVYNYTMVGVDIWGNVATDMVLVAIQPIPFIDAMLPWLLVGVIGTVVAIVIVITIRKRRK